MNVIGKLREPINGFTHFVGAILAVIGTIILINISLNPYKPAHLISFTIFGIGMILLYSTSTLYHWLKLSEDGVKQLRKADHIMIFVYIAATYTPICIVALRGTLGWSLLIAIWLFAIGGVIIKLFWMAAPRWLSTMIYVLMGWSAVVAIYPLINILPLAALLWLLGGGLFYTVGAIIYALKKPDLYPGLFGFHEIFHLFVMSGSFCHFWLMYKYIILLD